MHKTAVTTMVRDPWARTSERALLQSGFLRAWRSAPNRPALDVDDQVLSFAELGGRAAALATAIRQLTPVGGSQLTGVFAHRSSTAFAGLLGALFAGNGYVPLNRTFPLARTRAMLQTAGCRSIIVDSESEAQLDDLLEGIPHPLLILLPDRTDVDRLASRWTTHLVLGSDDLVSLSSLTRQATQFASPESVAYLLFTSGTAGIPKAVPVLHRNVTHFVSAMVERYDITPDDRFSQLFDHTFDLSVLDMFVAWERGACVCCPSERALLNPDRFVREKGLTIWTSVPSVAVLMKRFGALKPNRYGSLRWSFFCGEPLPIDVASTWAAAAPRSTVENLYGPTELTVACTSYRWDPRSSYGEAACGVVPIGHPFSGMQAVIVDEELHEVAPGATGELLMSGAQVTPGYWRNSEATARAYVEVPGKTGLFYRTGDRVRRPMWDGPMTYVGRVDHQVKVLGFRVELGEVEAALREEPGVENAVALNWPPTGTGGIVAFVVGSGIDLEKLRTNLRAKLQRYAIPRAIHVVPELPTNANGKIDRQALSMRLVS